MPSDWNFFREQLINWYDPDRRPMPWKGERDPYRIWLSEIILQQTRVEQGWPYFERFLAAFPTVADLAAAPDGDVMKLWEGLGYYSRARNLLRAARMVVEEYDGTFPDTYAGLLKLPGVGPYTAAAVASFAFDRQVAVLDGNVFRVLSRFAGDTTPIDTGGGKKHFTQLGAIAIGDTPAATYNQAIMDFGALVCTPRSADCPHCPLSEKCAALAREQVYDLPVKSKRTSRRDRFFHYLLLTDPDDRLVIHRREEKDIWRQLYQFPLVEAEAVDLRVPQLLRSENWPDWLPPESTKAGPRSEPYLHQLTHQRIGVVFHHLSWSGEGELPAGYLRVSRDGLADYALPRVITRYLEQRTLTLDF